jgi:hypothetical protein
VPKYNGEPHRIHGQCRPEDSAPLFLIHDNPNIAQGMIGVEFVCLSTLCRN